MFVYSLSPQFPHPPLLPQALAPVQSLTLAVSSARTSEMALAAPVQGAALIRSQISVRAPLARPFMLLLYFTRAPVFV